MSQHARNHPDEPIIFDAFASAKRMTLKETLTSMNTETPDANATIVPDESKELLTVIEQNHLQAETAQSLQQQFAPLFARAKNVIAGSRGIVVTDAKQTMEIKMARACRLELKAIRVTGEKARKELKEEYLRGGRAVDGFHAILEHLIATEEKRLEDQEKFAERQEAAHKQALKEARGKVLAEIQVDPNLYSLGEMDESVFQQLVEGTKLARAAEADRKRKEEAERIEREAKEQAERERIRLENERLKREAEERAAAEKADRERRANLHAERRAIMQPFVKSGDESANTFYGDMTDDQFGEAKAGAQNRWAARVKLEKEREAAENERKRVEAETARKLAETEEAARKERLRLQALAEVERQKAEAAKKAADEREAAHKAERAKIEADLKAERDAQAKRNADAEEAERKAAAAPDKDRLFNYANAIRAVEIPTFSTPEAQSIATVIKASRDKFAAWCDEKAGAL